MYRVVIIAHERKFVNRFGRKTKLKTIKTKPLSRRVNHALIAVIKLYTVTQTDPYPYTAI